MNKASTSIATPALVPIAGSGVAGSLLQPINLNNNNGNGNVSNLKVANAPPVVGSTWSDNLKSGQLNIDWDNLLTSKSSKSASVNSPSMNTLKAQVVAPTATPLVPASGLMKPSPLGLMHQQPSPTGMMNPSTSMGGNGFANFGAPTTTTMMMMPGGASIASSMVGSGLMNQQQYLLDNNNLNSNNNKPMNLQSLDFLQ